MSAPQPAKPRLTVRQADVLRLLASGKSNREIAKELGIGRETVKSHVTAAALAIGARNRTEAAVIAATMKECHGVGTTPAQRLLHHAVTTAPHGLTLAEAAHKVCLSIWRTSELMRSLRGMGLVEPTAAGGHRVRWASPELARAIRAEREGLTQRERERKERATALIRAKALAQAEADAAEDAAIAELLRPNRVFVKAGSVPPPSPRGPSSVFELAQV